MKNTSKRAGVVAAVITAAGFAGACPGTAFADTAPNHAPSNGPAVGGVATNQPGSAIPVAVHAPGGDNNAHAPILDGGPGRRGDNDRDWRGGDRDRRGDRDWRGDDRYRRGDRDWRGGDRDRRGDRDWRGDDWNWGGDSDWRLVHEHAPAFGYVVSDPQVAVTSYESQTGATCGCAGGNIAGTLVAPQVSDPVQVTGSVSNAVEVVELSHMRLHPRHECAPTRFERGDRFDRGERGERGERFERGGHHSHHYVGRHGLRQGGRH